MTLMLLWQEHSERHPEESIHSYSQFCETTVNLQNIKQTGTVTIL